MEDDLIKKYSLTDIIDLFCGKLDVYGSTEKDYEILSVIENYRDILEYMTTQLGKCSGYAHDYRLSVSQIGEDCLDILQDIKRKCEDYIEDANIDREDLSDIQ